MIKDTLYYKDNYLTKFDATVKECINDKVIKVVLDKTAFYPEGGGQPSDIGKLNDVNVLRVEVKNDIIYHIVDKEIPVGTKVTGEIDWDYRFLNMQSHTAEHIVSGIICKMFQTSNVGFHIGKDFITMDFPVDISENDLRNIEKMANQAVYKNIKIEEKIYSSEEAKDIEYRSKIELHEDIRIVKIEGYDICACCGVHVSRTGEIGIIKLLKVEKYKNGVRIYMLAGYKAVEDYTIKYEQVNKISVLLSLKPNEVYSGVENQLKEQEELKKEISSLKNKIYKQEISGFGERENIIVYHADMEPNDMRNYCNLLKEKTTNIAGVIADGRFLMMSNNQDLKQVLNDLKIEFDIKGGGSSQMIQGQFSGDAEALIRKFSK